MGCCCAEIGPESASAARMHIGSFIVGFSSVELWARDFKRFYTLTVATGRLWIMDFASCRISHATVRWFAPPGLCESCVPLHPLHKTARPWFCRLHIYQC